MNTPLIRSKTDTSNNVIILFVLTKFKPLSSFLCFVKLKSLLHCYILWKLEYVKISNQKFTKHHNLSGWLKIYYKQITLFSLTKNYIYEIYRKFR